MTNINGIELTEDERATLTHGLRIAAERFSEDAKVCMADPPHARLAEQFRLQVVATLALIERLENTEFIRVGPPVESEPEPDEPNRDDTVHCCPDCERPNQFGELCAECEREREAAHTALRDRRTA